MGPPYFRRSLYSLVSASPCGAARACGSRPYRSNPASRLTLLVRPPPPSIYSANVVKYCCTSTHEALASGCSTVRPLWSAAGRPEPGHAGAHHSQVDRGRTTPANLSLSHPECNRVAGQILWTQLRRDAVGEAPKKRSLSAEFWYETLLAAAPSSRVPSPSDPRFQIISAIESSVTIAECSSIHDLADLENRFGKGSWLKRKGQAIIRLEDGTIRRAELHWYEAHGIGRRWIKVKRYLDL